MSPAEEQFIIMAKLCGWENVEHLLSERPISRLLEPFDGDGKRIRCGYRLPGGEEWIRDNVYSFELFAHEAFPEILLADENTVMLEAVERFNPFNAKLSPILQPSIDALLIERPDLAPFFLALGDDQ